MKFFWLLFLVSSLFSNQAKPVNESAKVSPQFLSFNESLANFERQERLFFVFASSGQAVIREKDVSEESGFKKIINEFPVLSLDDDRKEMEQFYSYVEYKVKLRDLDKLKADFLADENLTASEKEYLVMYYQLILINLWIRAKELQQRDFDGEIFSLLDLSVDDNLDLPRPYLSNYFTFYAEAMLRLSMVVQSSFLDLLLNILYLGKKDELKVQSEIYLLKAIRLDKNNIRALFRYSVNSLVENKNNYFFAFNLITDLNRILKNDKAIKNDRFIINLILANIYYGKNDLSKSWSYLVEAGKLFPQSRILQVVQKNFKNRKFSLLKF